MPWEFAGSESGDTSLTSVTAGAGVGVAGSYVELFSSTARESNSLFVQLQGSTAKASFHIYIATGAAASETDVFEFIYYAGDTSSIDGKGHSFCVPLTIASGTRVSVKCAAGTSGDVVEVGLGLGSDSLVTPGANELIGATGLGVGYMGTALDPGASANTEATGWTEITASTSHAYRTLLISAGINNASAAAKARWLIDIATGAASSETIIIEDVFHASSTAEDGTLLAVLDVNIPSGTRISARCQCTNTNSAKRQTDVALVGINASVAGGGGSAGRQLIGQGGLIG